MTQAKRFGVRARFIVEAHDAGEAMKIAHARLKAFSSWLEVEEVGELDD